MSKSNPNAVDENLNYEMVCKNCDTSFTGHYCPNCGQHIKEIERPIRFMIVDFMGTVVSFDTRLVKTLVAILFKPGKLTQDFLEGKRARYMPPFRFYVFISFVMFLLISTLTNNSIKNNIDKVVTGDFNQEKIATLTDSTNVLRDSIINEVDKNLKEQLDSTQYESYKSLVGNTDSLNTDVDEMIEGFTHLSDSLDNSDSKYASTAKLIKEHPELYMNKLFQYTSWSLFLFMPIFAFFLWILFYKSKSLYVGHLIFALNIHSFIFTITSIVVAIALIFPNANTGWMGYLFLLTPIYQVIGARKLYKRKWISTFLKLTLVWFLYGFIWLIGLVVLILFTFFGL